MKETELLKKLWNDKPLTNKKTGEVTYGTRKSSDDLIIPGVISFDKRQDLTAGKWKFQVNGAFRKSLGIIMGSVHKTWKQTPFISFERGDSFDSQCGKLSITIEEAYPMKWDNEGKKMNQGFVRYKIYDVENGKYEIKDMFSVNQMEFLEELIGNKSK